jgi:hypothetical protein
MTDDVNHPEHYNKQGIEVIDVIEAYELPYHLGNVIKYVLRAKYKGREEQDIRKAFWYLERYIEEAFDLVLDTEDFDGEPTYSLEEVRAFFLGFDFATDQAKLDEVKDTLGRDPFEATVTTFGDLPTEPVFDGVDRTKDTPGVYHTDDAGEDHLITYVTSTHPAPPPPPETFVHTSASRIAGDDETAVKIKDEFYEYDAAVIRGRCGHCDVELRVSDDYLSDVVGWLYCGWDCWKTR